MFKKLEPYFVDFTSAVTHRCAEAMLWGNKIFFFEKYFFFFLPCHSNITVNLHTTQQWYFYLFHITNKKRSLFASQKSSRHHFVSWQCWLRLFVILFIRHNPLCWLYIRFRNVEFIVYLEVIKKVFGDFHSRVPNFYIKWFFDVIFGQVSANLKPTSHRPCESQKHNLKH